MPSSMITWLPSTGSTEVLSPPQQLLHTYYTCKHFTSVTTAIMQPMTTYLASSTLWPMTAHACGTSQTMTFSPILTCITHRQVAGHFATSPAQHILHWSLHCSASDSHWNCTSLGTCLWPPLVPLDNFLYRHQPWPLPFQPIHWPSTPPLGLHCMLPHWMTCPQWSTGPVSHCGKCPPFSGPGAGPTGDPRPLA